MILFFDTETTGLVKFDLPATDPAQPKIVQLAAILTDEEGAELSNLNFIIKPDGYVIPDFVSKIHGITTEIAIAHGVDLLDAVSLFQPMLELADTVVAYNSKFDDGVLNANLPPLNQLYWKSIQSKLRCAMLPMTDVCKIPFATKSGYKWPKLSESYKHCFNKDLQGAHNALSDVRATKEIWFWLKHNAQQAVIA